MNAVHADGDPSAEEFVARVSAFWSAPTPGGLAEILDPEVVAVQPLAPALRGLSRVQKEFERLLSLLPDLRAQTEGWRGDTERLFVDIHLVATVDGELVSWPAVDGFLVRGGLAIERVSYFDPLPFTRRMTRHRGALIQDDRVSYVRGGGRVG